MSRKRGRKQNYQKEYLSVDCLPVDGGEGEIYRVCYHDRFDGFFTDRKKAFSSLVQGLARRNDNEAIYVDRDGFSSVRSIYFFIGAMEDEKGEEKGFSFCSTGIGWP